MLSRLFNCRETELADTLNHPINVQKASEYLQGKSLETSYSDRDGEHRALDFNGFSTHNSAQQMAYNGYLRITVQQHFYIRHRIRLLYPNIKCIMAYAKSGRAMGYYPAELIRLKYSPCSTTASLSVGIGSAAEESTSLPELYEWTSPSTSTMLGTINTKNLDKWNGW